MKMLAASIVCCFMVAPCRTAFSQEPSSSAKVFANENLVAWCIVPFDAKKRGPADRAAMVKRLGLSRVAYDWRAEHVSSFEDEILQYKKHGIEYFAFWSWHESMAPLIRKHGIRPQIWQTCRSPTEGTQTEMVKFAADSMLPLVNKTKELGLQLGLYNHGGWGGEPANLVAVCDYLKSEHQADHVGIVYNFHHGHGHIDDFSESLELMKDYLLCLNLNGMADPAKADSFRKILPIGDGVFESMMLRVIADSGYAGPIGILDHRSDMDSEEVLRLNLDGLQKLAGRLQE